MQQPGLGLGLQPWSWWQPWAQQPWSGLAGLQQPCLALEAGAQEAALGVGLEAGEKQAQLALGLEAWADKPCLCMSAAVHRARLQSGLH